MISIFNQGAKKLQDVVSFVQILTINKTRLLTTDVHRLGFKLEQNCIFHFNTHGHGPYPVCHWNQVIKENRIRGPLKAVFLVNTCCRVYFKFITVSDFRAKLLSDMHFSKTEEQ